MDLDAAVQLVEHNRGQLVPQLRGEPGAAFDNDFASLHEAARAAIRIERKLGTLMTELETRLGCSLPSGNIDAWCPALILAGEERSRELETGK
jgi:hypothetical protein